MPLPDQDNQIGVEALPQAVEKLPVELLTKVMRAMPVAAQRVVLDDWACVRDNPGWIHAAIEVGAFNLDDASARSSKFVNGGHNAIERLCGALCERRYDAGYKLMEKDPRSGAVIGKGEDDQMPPLGWSKEINDAFGAVVDHVLDQMPLWSARPATSGKKKQVFATDQNSADMGMLLCTACAGGHEAAVEKILKAWPGARMIPVSGKLMGIYQQGDMYTPMAFAAYHNQISMLELLECHGQRPDDIVRVQTSFNASMRRYTFDPNEKKAVPKRFFAWADCSPSDLSQVWPSTAEHLIRQFADHLRSMQKGEPRDFQTTEFVSVLKRSVNGTVYPFWFSSLRNAGMIEEFANDLTGSAVERVAGVVKRASSTTTQIENAYRFLDRFVRSLDWPTMTGESFPAHRAMESGNEACLSLALRLIDRCVESGHASMLTTEQPNMNADRETSDGTMSLGHLWAKRGWTPLVLKCLEQGLDPQSVDPVSGFDLVTCAEKAGGDTLGAIRAFQARQAASEALREIGIEP